MLFPYLYISKIILEMSEYLLLHKSEIFWVFGVIVVIFLLRTLTEYLHNKIANKDLLLLREERVIPLILIKHLINLVWWILGLITLVFVFVEAEEYKFILDKFYLILYLVGLVLVTVMAANIAQHWFKKNIQKKIDEKEDPSGLKFYRYVAIVAIYFFGLLFALLAFPSLRNVAQAALSGAGVLAIIFGLAAQEALSNLIGGVFIISFKPFKIGDKVKVTDTMVGTVTDITLRHTVIRNFENKMIVIPNSVINKEKLINYDLGENKCCEHVQVGISYESDVVLAKKIMQDVCEKHPLTMDNRTKIEKKNGAHMVKTALISLDDSSVTLRAWVWAKNFDDSFQIKCDVLEEIKQRFKEEGVNIPYPNRTLHIVKEK